MPNYDFLDHPRWTGLDEIDADHVRLLGAIESLRLAPAAAWTERLERLEEVARRHFQYEEAIMHEVDYPMLGFHRAHHLGFLGRLRRGRHALTVSGSDFAQDLKTWLGQHIAEHDQSYAIFVHAWRGKRPHAS